MMAGIAFLIGSLPKKISDKAPTNIVTPSNTLDSSAITLYKTPISIPRPPTNSNIPVIWLKIGGQNLFSLRQTIF